MALKSILLHDYGAYAFTLELARALARRGHRVAYAYSGDLRAPSGPLAPRPDDPAAFSLHRLATGAPLAKYAYLRRRRQERRYAARLVALLDEIRPDIVLSANTPLEALHGVQGAAARIDARFIHWLQDIHWIAIRGALRTRLPLLGRAVAVYYRRVERGILGESDLVIAIADEFLAECEAAGVRHVVVHPNWAPLAPVPRFEGANPWAARHGLIGKTCLLYAGTLGLKHDASLFLDLADRFRGRDDVRVVVVSEGSGAAFLRAEQEKAPRANLVLLPFQGAAEVPAMLDSAAVLLAVLEPDAGLYSVPSKILTYAASGKPVVAAMPLANPAARLIVDRGLGIVVDAGDRGGFCRAAETLVADEARRANCSRAGRAYAEENFDIAGISLRFEEIFSRVGNPA